ncbi:MAG TPA: PUA domain-containing protein, partial [Methanomicrobiales archaeon]|nr:PUA domain-containing protein [Methanomicrobiales archaeon]
RSGSYSEEIAHTLFDLQDAAVYARQGDRSEVDGMILPIESAIAGIPRVVIRDTAVDAICHGAALAGVGVIRADTFKKGDDVAIISQKGEVIAIGEALVDSNAFQPGETGLIVQPRAVMMLPGTYARGWKSHTDEACP